MSRNRDKSVHSFTERTVRAYDVVAIQFICLAASGYRFWKIAHVFIHRAKKQTNNRRKVR